MKRRFWAVAAAFLVVTVGAVGALAQEPPPLKDSGPVPQPGATEPAKEASGLASQIKVAKSDVGKWGYNTIYAGAIFRPQFCLHNCIQTNYWQNKYLMTYGVEVGDRYFGLAIRYGQERRFNAKDGILRTVHQITPDVRFFYNWKFGPMLLAPFIEISPTILFGGASGIHMVLRPGVRATFLLARFLDLTVEPFALDIDWYRWERYGSYSLVDLRPTLRYSVSIGLHARW